MLEGALFLVCLLLFFSNPVEMVYIWFHVLHCFRCYLGITIYRRMPRSHQMAANMSIPLDEKMPIDNIMKYVLLAAKDALTAFTSSTKTWLLAYFIITIVCLALDLTTFFI